MGRPTQKDLPGGELDVLYQHDLLGRPTQASNPWGYVQMTHDALGRLTRERSASGGWFDMEYDAAGRMTKITHPWGDFPVTYDYLATGEVSRIREYGATSGIGVVASYGYDDLGRRTSETRGNGTGTSYGYDAVGRLGSMGHDMAGTTHDLSVTFGYNPAGQIVSRNANNDTYSHTGLANQNVTDSHNGLNQVTASASLAVTHDAKGNTSGIGSTAYTYDSENKMTGAGGTALHYDPLGRLASIAGGRAGSDYVGDRLMVERNSGGLPDRHFVQTPGEEAPAVWYEGYAGSTNRRFLHKDERGSVIAVSDNSGNVTAVNRYDDYGKPDGAVTGRFGYTGQQWLPEIGLSYYKARMYNPGLTGSPRFMQPDPIGMRGGINLYGAFANDPINRVDQLGLQDQPIPAGEDVIEVIGCRGGVRDGRGRCVRGTSESDTAFALSLIRLPGSLIGDIILDWIFEPGTHDVETEVFTLCSSEEAFEHFRQPYRSAPGAPYAEAGLHSRTLTGGNPISQFVDVPNMTITNSTLEGHIFYPGSIIISVTSSGMFSTIHLKGTGTGSLPRLNDALFFWFFAGTANDIAQICEGSPIAP